MLARGTPEQHAMAQEALNRWWWPTLMQFGYPDAESPHTEKLKRWGVKTKTNDELREQFIREIVPELRLLGLEPPDRELRFDEATGRWMHGPIDFDELKRVVNGDGPCNKARLGARIKAHEDGTWVREALLAYNSKQKHKRELSEAHA